MSDAHADEDEPITLSEACSLLFKGRIGPDTLKKEAARGRLVIEKIGRSYFTTRAAVKEMRRKCVVAPPPKDQDSGSNQLGSEPTAVSPPPDGASATTDDTSIALTSALQSVEALSKLSATTSRASTKSRRGSLSLVKG